MMRPVVLELHKPVLNSMGPHFAGEHERRRAAQKRKQSISRIMRFGTDFRERLWRPLANQSTYRAPTYIFGVLSWNAIYWHQSQPQESPRSRAAVLNDPAKRGWYFARFGWLSSCHTRSTSMAFWVMGDTHIISLMSKNHLPTPSGSVINRHSLFYCRILYLA